MRILITGGSGLLGRRLVAELTGEGHEVVVLSRRPEAVQDLPTGARAAAWDGATAEPWAELLGGDCGILHLAGEGIASGRWSEEKKRRIRDSRVASSRAVLAAIEQAPTRPRWLVQASAVGYYGEGGDRELAEDAGVGNDFLARVCTAWEGATEPVEGLGVRRVLLRTGVVLDPEGGALPRLAQPFRWFVGGPLGSGRQWVPWIHVADQVAAMRFLLATETAVGPYNLTAPNPVRNRDLARAVGRVLHRPSLLPVPPFALRLALGEMAELLLVSQRAIPERLLEAGFEFQHPRLEGALEDLLG